MTAITTSVFELLKIGPGTSSSHTIGPMKAGRDFHDLINGLDPAVLAGASRLEVNLYGSLWRPRAKDTAPIALFRPSSWAMTLKPAPRRIIGAMIMFIGFFLPTDPAGADQRLTGRKAPPFLVISGDDRKPTADDLAGEIVPLFSFRTAGSVAGS